MLDSERTCRLHCEDTYIKQDKSLFAANRKVARFYLKRSTKAADSRSICCCRYNAPWPAYVQPSIAGLRPPNQVRGATHASRSSCLPLILGLGLSKRTVDSYNRLCKLLNKSQPLTMAEAVEFAQLAVYLNYMRPKHPLIRATLRQREIERVSKEALEQLERTTSEFLLASQKSIEEYDGYQLDPVQLVEFDSLRRFKLDKAVRSRVVAKAFDEYVVSYAAVDMAAASKRITEINQSEFKIPARLLRGDYDKYDTDSRSVYFTKDDIDCWKLKQAKARLVTYLASARAVLSSLNEKLFFEHMSEKYFYLAELIRSKILYENLIEVNCQKR